MNSTNEYYREKIQDWEIVEFEVRVREVRQLIDIVDKKKIFELLKK
jgi:hypothetical protein